MLAGDAAAVVELLDPDVVLVSDGGPTRRAARRPVVGPERVARLLVNLAGRVQAGSDVSLIELNGRPALRFEPDDGPFVMQIDQRHGRIVLGLVRAQPREAPRARRRRVASLSASASRARAVASAGTRAAAGRRRRSTWSVKRRSAWATARRSSCSSSTTARSRGSRSPTAQRQQLVGQGRVAGQHRAVQVGGHHPPGHRAVGSVAVAHAHLHPPQRAGSPARGG